MLVEWLTLTGWVVAAVLLILGCFVAVLFYRGTRRPRRPVRRAAELGKAALRGRRFDDAVKYLSVALRFAPEAVGLYLRRAEAWQGLGKTRRAETDCGKAIALAKYTAEPYRVRGQIYADANELNSAIADFLRAAELDADDNESLAIAAGLLIEVGQPERAFNIASKVVHRNPEHAEGYYLRGLAQERLGRFDAAFQEYASALQLDPHRRDLPERLERCKTAGGEVAAEAPVDLVEVPPVVPVFAPTVPQLLRSAAEHLAKANTDAALTDLTAALDLDADDTAALIQRGWIWVNHGDFARGLADFDRACRWLPDDADALYGRGRCRQHAGEWEAAIEDYDRILTVNPNIATVRFHRGQCRLETGNYAGAAADLGAAVALDPKNLRTKHLFARVLATCPVDEFRDGPRAVELADEVVRKADAGEHRATLACAFAEAGDFVAAVEQAQTALRDTRLSEDLRTVVSSYCAEFWAGRAVRMPATSEPAVPVTVSSR